MSPISPDPRHAGRALVRAARSELARLRRIRGPGRRTARRVARAQVALAAGLLAAVFGDEAGARTPVFVNPLIPFGLRDLGGHTSPAFGDLDGDGDLDALVGETLGIVGYFENTGTRAFPAFADADFIPFGLADVGDFAAPTFADIDSDGDLDVFVGGALGSTTFFENTGGASAPALTAAAGEVLGLTNVGFDAAPEFADLDGDGDLDAFIGEGASGGVFHFENTGTSTAPAFAAPVTNPFGLAGVGFDASPRFADLDGDGDLDALLGNADGDFFVFPNTGTAQAPAFAAPATNPFGLGNFGELAAPAFADLDADGDVEVLAGVFAGNVVLFSNVGSERAPAFLGPIVLDDVGSYASPAFGDLDGDGDFDGLVGNGSGSLQLFRNTGTPAAPVLGPASPVPPGLSGGGSVGDLTAPDLADLDADGDLDAMVGTLEDGTFLFVNTGSSVAPAFAAPIANPAGLTGVVRAAPTLVDLDADGNLDAFLGHIDGDTVLFANTGTPVVPAFAASTPNPFGLPAIDTASTPAFADVDADGDLDFLTGENDGDLTFALNAGTPDAPSFGLPLVNSFGLGRLAAGSAPAFADVDADGDPDLFVGRHDGTTVFFANLTPLCPPAPEPGCASFETGSLSVDERSAGKEKLALKLARGPAVTQASFGDPTEEGGAALSLCVYDDVGARAAALEVRRAGDECGAKPCWKPIGKAPPDGKGFVYRDPVGEADGVRSIRLAGGPEGRSSVAVAASNRAKKNERGMTTGIAAALAGATEVTVQVHGADTCLEVELTEITKQEPDRFKAK